MHHQSQFMGKFKESLFAVLPITAIVLLLSIFMVPLDVGATMMFFVGAAMLIVGMALFQLGVDMSMSPMGEGIGVQLSKSKSLAIIAGVSLLIGILPKAFAEEMMRLLRRELKLGIMQAISEKCGVHSETKGIVISVPLDNVLGLDEYN